MKQVIMLSVVVMCALGCESKLPPATVDAAPTSEEAPPRALPASSRVEVPAWTEADIAAMSLEEAKEAIAQLGVLRSEARRNRDSDAEQELRRLWRLVRNRMIEFEPDLEETTPDGPLVLPARTEAEIAAMSLAEAQTALLDLKTFLKQADGNMDAETAREFERQWEFVKRRILDERKRDGD